ncbi:hypothetical protein KC333_g3926 [Hortaea werneckii]|nr:hypothetical protein KC333_g3926 [Hortaea werneckii]KAI7313720.1 hypothetical protein KC326_g5416 [Hortaea werneckii]
MPPSPPSAGAGGFLLSPAPSSTNASTITPSTLPHPRASPLRPGGSKESAFIRHVDTRILHIQRRFAKRTTPSDLHLPNHEPVEPPKGDAWGDVHGYATMKEACRDIRELVDIIWISGTPGLQVPYLISLALLVGNLVTAMPPSPRSLFRLLGKLDHAFASLIQGRDVESGEVLPGFEGRRGVSGTEKVRIRSLVERTRVGVVESFKRGEFEFEGVDGEEDRGGEGMDVEEGDDGGLVLENGDPNAEEEEEEDDSFDMQLARVYDRTIQELGDSLEEPGIGIVTEPRG